MNNQLHTNFSSLNPLQQYQHINQNIHLTLQRLGQLNHHIIQAATGSNATLSALTSNELAARVRAHILDLNVKYQALQSASTINDVSDDLHNGHTIEDDVYNALSDVFESLQQAHSLHVEMIDTHHFPNPIVQNMNDSSSSEGSSQHNTDVDSD